MTEADDGDTGPTGMAEGETMATVDVSGECPGPGLWSRIRAGIGPAVVWSAWAAAMIAAVLFVRQYAKNIPFYEDFLVIPVMTRHEPISLEWAWRQNLEHRPVIPRLILGVLYRTIPDFRAGMYLNAGLMSAAAASMILLARRLRGRTSVIDAVLPLSILNLGQVECLLIGFALNLILTTWISFELIGIVAHPRERPAWWQVLRFGGAVLLLSLSGGSGLVMLPPLVLWLAVYIASGWWSGRDPGASARALGLGLLMMTTAVVAHYLYGYQRPQIPPPPSIGAVANTTLAFLSLVISPSVWGNWQIAGAAVVLLSAVTFARLMLVAWGSPIERPRALGLIAILLSLLWVAVAVGLSRSGLAEPGMVRASRYVSLSAPILSALYIIWLLYGSTPERRTRS
jgi:hypothetical protein